MGTSDGSGGGSVGTELVGGQMPEKGAAAVAGGRRGMHSACGAYWNNERDGMWSFKYETKGSPSLPFQFKKTLGGERGLGAD